VICPETPVNNLPAAVCSCCSKLDAHGRTSSHDISPAFYRQQLVAMAADILILLADTRLHPPVCDLTSSALWLAHNNLMRITLVLGDITEQRVDAIVNAANSSLLGGGGVDGAIHRKGGPAILEECRKLRASHYGRGLGTGQAVATTAGNLPARWVIHTVGPVYSSTDDGSELLASCYRESLRIAHELGAETVAFPAISTGIYGWPMASAADIAVRAIGLSPISVNEVRFVLFSDDAYAAFATALSNGQERS
jgi:O-acetyl-ADP-ribose deacetylase